MAGRQCVALPNPLLVAARGALWGAARGGIAQKRVARGSGAGRIAGARSAEALKEGRGARGRVHNLDECRAQTCRMSPIRDTRQVCARIRQVCERLACHPARMRRGAPRSAHSGAKVSPKDRIFIDGPDKPRCGPRGAAGQRVGLSVDTARAPKNPILWRDFCMASRAYAPERLFRAPSALFPAGQGAGTSGLPAGAPEGGPACRGAKYKTMHVALENVTARRLGLAPHCTVACRKCSRIYRWCSLAHL